MIDIVQARESLRERRRAKANADLVMHRHAMEDARKIIEMIINNYNPKRITQWGSVLNPADFDGRSDIDIAIEGVTDAESFFRLLGEAMDMTGFPLDIVQMEKIEPEFADIIRLKGKVVYER